VRAEIERAIAVLTAEPFWGSARAADMEMFAFGPRILVRDRHGREVTKSEFGLHVQCPWRLERDGAIVVGSWDLYVLASGEEPESDFNWEPQGSNRRDVLLETFFHEWAPSVERVEASSIGDLSIFLTQGFRLAVFPIASAGESEHWRFLRVASEDPHVVLRTDGLSLVS
jgi:hypothetical protein